MSGHEDGHDVDLNREKKKNTTMAGMIRNASRVLDLILDPTTGDGVPRELLRTCRGVVLISAVEVGLVFSGNVGTGVVMARRRDDEGIGRGSEPTSEEKEAAAKKKEEEGRWSPPSAVGLAGFGAGLLAGAEVKDLIVFILDDSTMDAFAGSAQVKVGAEWSLTLPGFKGREREVDLTASADGDVGGCIAYTFTEGLFANVGIETAVIKCKAKENEMFYGRELTPREVLFGDDAALVAASNSEGTGVPELHRKLNMLRRGEAAEAPTASELARKEGIRAEAEKEAERRAKEDKESQGKQREDEDAPLEADPEEKAQQRPKEKTPWEVLHAPDEAPDAAQRVAEKKEAQEAAKEEELEKIKPTGFEVLHSS